MCASGPYSGMGGNVRFRNTQFFSTQSRNTRLCGAAFLFALSLVLLAGGCSGQEPQSESSEFNEGTLSSSTRPAETTGGLQQPPRAAPEDSVAGEVSLRVEGAEGTRFSGICTVGEREEIISGSPPRSYTFEDRPFSCTVEKQDSRGGNLKVTVVAGDSARSVQQTNAEGGTIELSYES